MYLTFVDSAPLPMPPPPTPPRPVFFHPTRPIILARNFLRFSISSTRLSRYRTLSDIEGEGEGGHSRVLHSRVVERLLVSSRFVLSSTVHFLSTMIRIRICLGNDYDFYGFCRIGYTRWSETMLPVQCFDLPVSLFIEMEEFKEEEDRDR